MSAIIGDVLTTSRIEPQSDSRISSEDKVVDEGVTIKDNRSSFVSDSVLSNGEITSEILNVVTKTSSLEIDTFANSEEMQGDFKIIVHESPRHNVILTNENSFEEINLISDSPKENLVRSKEDEALNRCTENPASYPVDVLENNVSDVDNAHTNISAVNPVPLVQTESCHERKRFPDNLQDNLLEIPDSPKENLNRPTEDETLNRCTEKLERLSVNILINNVSDVDNANANISTVNPVPLCNSVTDQDNLAEPQGKATDDLIEVNSKNIVNQHNSNGVNVINGLNLQTPKIEHPSDDIQSVASNSIDSRNHIEKQIMQTSINVQINEPVMFMKSHGERNFDRPRTFGNSWDLAASAERSWKSMETFHSHDNDEDDNDEDDNVISVRAKGTPTRHSVQGNAWSPSLDNSGNLIRGSASFSYYNSRGHPSLSAAAVSPSFSIGRAAGNKSDSELGGMSAIDMDNAGFEEINLQSSSMNESTDGVGGSDRVNVETVQPQSAQPSGFARFFRRSLFSKSQPVVAPPVVTPPVEIVEDKSKINVPGWQFFANGTSNQSPSQEYNDSTTTSQPNKSLVSSVKMRTNKEAPSTTALIFHRRPSELPAKDPLEEIHHQQLNEEMIETARKIEKKDKKLREKRRLQQIREEEQLSAAVRTWKTEILPSWHIERHSRRTRELWWNGIPSCVRGKVWKLAIGNDLNVTSELYEICTQRAKEKLRCLREPKSDVNAGGSDTDSLSSITEFVNRESSVELIAMDVSRTFPQLCIFQKKGPYHNLLKGLLGAYACYRPDVGYVQGMSFLAAVLLLNMEVIDTFICFANLLNKPSNVAFFNLDQVMMKAYFDTYREFFKENLPRLFAHFEVLQMNPDLYIIDWMYTMFAKSLPLDVTSRVWDVFFRDGEEFLFRTALGILCMYEDILLRLDFIHVAQFLTRLPEDLSGDELFRCIGLIHMLHEKQVFELVLARNQERCAAQAAAFALTQTLSPPST